MTTIRIIILSVLIITIMNATSEAGWLIYHKPDFKGRVIDAETKAPIEGAVVVVIYEKHSLISGPGGGYSSVIKTKETLTDQKGEFHFSSYTTVIQPNSIEDYARFTIYKPGYGSFPNLQIVPSALTPVDEQVFFSKEIGSSGELEMWVKEEKGPELRMSKVTFGLVRLPKLLTREERLRAIPTSPTDIRSQELPLLFKAINEERKRFGLGEVK